MSGAICAIFIFSSPQDPFRAQRAVVLKVPYLHLPHGNQRGDSRSNFRIGNRGQKRDLGTPRVEPRVLNDDGNVGFEYGGIVSVARNRLRVVEIVEAQVQSPPRRDGDAVRADRIAVGEENSDGYVRITVRGVKDARGLVGDKLAIGIGAFRGNVAFRDCPSPTSDGVHRCLPCPPKTTTPTARFSFPSGGTFFIIRRKQLCCELRSGAWRSGTGAQSFICGRQGEPNRGNPRAAMRAITVLPGTTCSARLEEVPEPAESDGPILVHTWALGVCGT